MSDNKNERVNSHGPPRDVPDRHSPAENSPQFLADRRIRPAHLTGMDLNLLVSLDALLTEKSVTRAATRMSVSQPAMSAALHKLRWHLSDPLLERVGRQLELTPRAKELALPVKNVLLEMWSVLNHEQRFDPAVATRTFRLAMSSYCVQIFGVPVIEQLRRVAPNVRCHFDEITADVFGRLQNGVIDFCVTLGERALLDPNDSAADLSDEHLFFDRFMLVSAADNATVDDEIHYDAFCRLAFVETRFGGSLTGIVERALRWQSHRPTTCIIVPNATLALSMVSKTSLVTIAPTMLVAAFANIWRLKVTRAPLEMPLVDETLYWHPRNDADPVHLWFRNFLGSVARNDLQPGTLHEPIITNATSD